MGSQGSRGDLPEDNVPPPDQLVLDLGGRVALGRHLAALGELISMDYNITSVVV